MDMAQPDGEHHNQIDYILVKKRFRSGVNTHRAWSFLRADIGSDHDLVMLTFRVRLKKARKPNQPTLRFDLEKLRDLYVICSFLSNDRWEIRITHWTEKWGHGHWYYDYHLKYRTDAASEILEKERRRKSRGSPKMLSTSVMRGEICRRSGMKQKEQKTTGKQTGGFRRQWRKQRSTG